MLDVENALKIFGRMVMSLKHDLGVIQQMPQADAKLICFRLKGIEGLCLGIKEFLEDLQAEFRNNNIPSKQPDSRPLDTRPTGAL